MLLAVLSSEVTNVWAVQKLCNAARYIIIYINGSCEWQGPYVASSLNWDALNPSVAKLFNLIFHPLEVVSRWRHPQLQVSANYSDLTKRRFIFCKSCWLVSRFIFHMYKADGLCANKKCKNKQTNIIGAGGLRVKIMPFADHKIKVCV